MIFGLLVVNSWFVGFNGLIRYHWFGLLPQFPGEEEGAGEEKEEVGPCTGQEGLARHQQEGLVPFVSKYIDLHHPKRRLVYDRWYSSLFVVQLSYIGVGKYLVVNQRQASSIVI